jgi:hypothetical protein
VSHQVRFGAHMSRLVCDLAQRSLAGACSILDRFSGVNCWMLPLWKPMHSRP